MPRLQFAAQGDSLRGGFKHFRPIRKQCAWLHRHVPFTGYYFYRHMLYNDAERRPIMPRTPATQTDDSDISSLTLTLSLYLYFCLFSLIADERSEINFSKFIRSENHINSISNFTQNGVKSSKNPRKLKYLLDGRMSRPVPLGLIGLCYLTKPCQIREI